MLDLWLWVRVENARHEFPGPWRWKSIVVAIEGAQQCWPEAQESDYLGAYLRLNGPGRPFLHVYFEVQMDEPVTQWCRHSARDCTVRVAVSSGNDGPTLRQYVF